MRIYGDKKVVIIGGTSGMGMGIARAFIKAGAEVLLTARTLKALDEAKAELGTRAVTVQSDVTVAEDRHKLADIIKQHFGTFDYLFVNVGICEVEPFVQVTEDSYDRQFNTNTKGAFFSMQALVPLMKDEGGIVFTSSVADKMGIPGMAVYSATKAALVSMAQSFAAELLPRGIRVNALSVGYAHTPSMGVTGFTEAQKQAFVEDGKRFTPLGRIASVAEFGQAAMFLAAEATFITGVNVPFDGGIGLGMFARQAIA